MPGGGGGSHTVNTDPWTPQRPYLEHGFREAEGLYQHGGPAYYAGDTVAGFAPETDLAHSLITRRVREGSPALGAARGHLGDTLGGRHLGGSPHLDAVEGRLERFRAGAGAGGGSPHLDTLDRRLDRFHGGGASPHVDAVADRLARDVRGRVDSRFAAANRTASARHGEALGRGLGDAMAPLYHGAHERDRDRALGSLTATLPYRAQAHERERDRALGSLTATLPYRAQAHEGERNRMLQGMMFAPNLAAHDFREYGALAGVGAQRQGQRQAEIDARRERHDFDQLRPYDNLERYQRMVRGNFGQTSTQPLYRNRGASLLGGGLAGGQLAHMLGVNPWIGAGLGGFAGLL